MNLDDRVFHGASEVPEEARDPVRMQGIRIAMQILVQCRKRLMMSLRFMDRALWQMTALPADLPRMMASDGRYLHFDPDAVIDAYEQNSAQVARAYLHTVLHCVFRHPMHTIRADTALWSLACDISVEAVALELCDGRLKLQGDSAEQQVIAAFSQLEVPLTPAGIYRALLTWRDEPCPDPMLSAFIANGEAARELFARDSHKPWRLVSMRPQQGGGDSGGQGESGDGEPGEQGSEGSGQDNAPDDQTREGDQQQAPDGPGAGNGQDDDADDDQPSDQPSGGGNAPGEKDDSTMEPDSGSGGAGDRDDAQEDSSQQRNRDIQQAGASAADAAPASPDDGNAPDGDYEEAEALQARDPRDDELEDVWKSIASEIETALQSFEKRRGDNAGNTMGNLQLATRGRADYEAFLRRFATIAEDIKLNNDEFDYLFYTYGLDHYGNMPLVEPLEYCEDMRIRDFVIALDTSGSCSNGLTRIFLTRTYDILRKSVRDEDRVCIHIVQCDAEVQSDTVITCLEDILEYERNLHVSGFGGTDFQPVFAYVDQLVADGVFDDLRGLVYFTDGMGVYPDHAPAYDVAFVFVENEGATRRVPPWACKVIMSDDDIEQLGWET